MILLAEMSFFQTSMFIWVLVSLLIFLALLTAYLFVQHQITKKKFRKQVLKSKYLRNQLLLAQMNPHFTFNVLASIQNKILTDKKKEASDYIVKLSVIIRNFLQSSHKALEDSEEAEISLEKELELLQSFIEFEQMKSDNHFDWNIHVSPDIIKHNIFVPPMLIQPFVENAIKHGLLLVSRKGRLTISFSQERGNLVCDIYDNGIGRIASERINSKMKGKRKSLGTKIVEERIQLLNQLGYDIHYKITDNNPSGTIVSITIDEV